MQVRDKVGMLLAEVFGTAALTLVVLVQLNAVGAVISSPWFVAASAGLTMAMIMLVFGPISGGHANPATTIAAWTMKRIPTSNAIAYIASQVLGALAAFSLFQYVTDSSLANIAGGFEWRVFIAVMTGAFVFTLGVVAAAVREMEGVTCALTCGVSFMLGMLVASVVSNGLINPAVALGANSWNWTYVLAPIAGAVLGGNVYGMFMSPMKKASSRKK